MSAVEIQVPDIGDFSDVPVIEIHVSPGDTVAVDDPLVTLESDKATMDVPSPSAGTVSELRIGVGDTVSQGSVLMVLEAEGAAGTPPKEHVHESAHPDPGEKTGYGSASGVYDKIEVSVPTSATLKQYRSSRSWSTPATPSRSTTR
jgi:dihydrolipoamide dehydrogenase